MNILKSKNINKVSKYKGLQIEHDQLWGKKGKVVLIVVGALGTIPKNLGKTSAYFRFKCEYHV